MHKFNSGTTGWFAWAAVCLSVIRTCSNSQCSGSWNRLLTRERGHACATEKECECSLCAMTWFIHKSVSHHDKAGTALSWCSTRQNKTPQLVQPQKRTQVDILIFTCFTCLYSVCKFIHAKGRALICAYNSDILKLNRMTQASLYIYLCTFLINIHNTLLLFAWLSTEDK